MYIKLKHIKIFFLILTCVFFAGLNYFSFVKAEDSSNVGNFMNGSSTTSTGESSTNNYIQNLSTFIQSKGSTPVTTADIQNFNDSQVAQLMGPPITFDSLPQVDTSQIKILPQQYSNLSPEDQKNKKKDDLNSYIKTVIYLLYSNSPQTILSSNDANNFYQDFLSKLEDPGANKNYFSDLGNRLATFSEQLNQVQVPETMLSVHVKLLRLIQGILSLRNEPTINAATDPIQSEVTLLKAGEYVQLVNSFYHNDFGGYVQQLNSNMN